MPVEVGMEPWLWICLSLLGGLFLLKFLYLISAGWALSMTRGALFIPTSSIRIKTFLDALPMNSKEFFLDLGCGDGRVLREARNRYGVKAMGFEVNLFAYLVAKVLSFRFEGVQIRWRNFWEVDLGHADVVFCYLFPDVMERLAKKLEAELRPGAKVVSSNFPLPGWRPFQVLRPPSGHHRDPIYIYRFPNSCQTSEVG
jgi:SAM-dependent methyltransferase